MSKIQYTYNYQLTLDGRGFAGDKNVILQNDKRTETIYGGISMTLSLYGVTFRRKVYEPGSIRAEILIQTKDTALPSVDLLTSMLIRRPVSLSIEKSHYAASKKAIDSTPIIAQNYYIHEISPQFEKRTTRVEEISKGGGHIEKNVSYNWIYIKLEIFSFDKLLTLSKYSQAHFGETLFGDILKNNIDSFQLRFKKTADSTTTISVPIEIETDTTKLEMSHLFYLDTDGTTQVELIQPYLVQYNESFYDFLRRTANRCGEVFYFEDGKFCVGVSKADSTPIDDSSRVIFQRISEGALKIGDFARDSLKRRNQNDTYDLDDDKVITDPIETDKDNFPKDAFPEVNVIDYDVHPYRYNSEVASEDHYMMLFKDKFAHDSVHDLWCGEGTEHVMRTISQLLNSTSLMEFVTNTLVKEMESAAKASAKSQKTNDKWLTLFEDYRLTSTDKSAVIPKTKVDRNKWITLNYVKDIRDFEQAQMRGMVCVDMGTGFINVKLGDKITLPSPNESKTYVVVQIDMSSGQDWQRSYDGFIGGETPMRGEQSQRIYAIPMATKLVDSKETEVFYPPLLPGEPFRRSGAQPAFVIDSKDPAGQGRVRIRYPWQPHFDSKYKDIDLTTVQSSVDSAKQTMEAALTELKKYVDEGVDIVIPEEGDPVQPTKKASVKSDTFNDAWNKFIGALTAYREAQHAQVVSQAQRLIQEAGSPWIRMATPMATSGGGMFFCPEKGDEVMVDFENGNVERPYVTGTLYSKNVPAPKEGSRVIVSKNGHTIKMSDPSDGIDLLAGMLPAVKFLQTYGAFDNTKIGMTGNTVEMLGGIELTDQLGLYNIKMSSHDRLISIASPFGNVNISALTGISIEAPNGDITISGKNIDITAYNKLSISSGKNIKMAYDSHRLGYFSMFANASEAGKQTGKAMSKLFGINKLLDLSLVRTLLEIFLRPIDGTLSLKAYRFLTLEAGGGGTAMDEAQYDLHRTDAYKQCRDVKALELMMLYIKDTVGGYLQAYEEKFNKVRGDYQAVKVRYPSAGAADITVPASGLDLLKKLFHDIDTNKTPKELKADKETFVTTAASLTIAAAITDETVKKEIRDEVRTLFDSICALKKHVNSYLTMFGDMKSGLWKAHSDAKVSKAGAWEQAKSFARLPSLNFRTDASSVLQMDNPLISAQYENTVSQNVAALRPAAAPAAVVVQPPTPTAKHSSVNAAGAAGFKNDGIDAILEFVNQTAADDTLFNNPFSAANFATWKKYVCRRLACIVIEKCRTQTPFASFSIAPAEYKPFEDNSAAAPAYTASQPIDMAFPFTDADWPRYVNEIKITMDGNDNAKPTGGEKFVTGMVESLTEAAKKIFPGESLVWKQEASKGKILFSDTGGKTFHFKEDGKTDFYINQNKALLGDVEALRHAIENV